VMDLAWCVYTCHCRSCPYRASVAVVVGVMVAGVDVDDGTDSDAEETDIGLPPNTPFTPGLPTYGTCGVTSACSTSQALFQ
jgi:hypothetical protein